MVLNVGICLLGLRKENKSSCPFSHRLCRVPWVWMVLHRFRFCWGFRVFVLRQIFNDVSCQKANEYVSHWTTYFLGLFYYCFTSITQNVFGFPLRPGQKTQGRGVRYICWKTIRSYITKQIFLLDVSGNCFHFCQYRLHRYLDLMYYAARCVFTCVYGGEKNMYFFA